MTTISLKQINSEKVEPIDVPQYSHDEIMGSNLFEELYANIFLLAKKKSGKTSAIFNILKKCCGKNTHVIIFCTTVHKDYNWLEIVKWLEKTNKQYETFTSIVDEGENLIESFLKNFTNEKVDNSEPYNQN